MSQGTNDSHDAAVNKATVDEDTTDENFDDDDEVTEEDLAAEGIFDEWLALGWFSIAPSVLFSITEAARGLHFTRAELAESIALNIEEHGYRELDSDPLWLVADPETAADLELAEEGGYDAYLEGERTQRANWGELGSRSPKLAVTTVDEFIDLLCDWNLLVESDGVLELLDPVPDPVDLLPLTNPEKDELLESREPSDFELVDGVLHAFIYHSDESTMVTTIGKLAQQADVAPEMARLILAGIIASGESGLTADRFGPMEAEAITDLADHQKFTLVVDRDSDAIKHHAH
ncbi:hypothetical protein EH165_02810 [Nakamurella antarctica]|uniref:Uncharacterized protein n=1 Tax=Nakamurella antarctica TaxID=1902245 RepID=A0A3G8ZJ74_9ACTN|nr:DUF6042 family protein [Nakamurella antarctica]AZI57248.1 hypothetical protein EH165_02810 [Nakamurella antarctica]